MKKKIALFLLTAVFLLAQTSFVDAKARSFSSGSRSFSSGYKGSSKSSVGSSKKSGGYSGSSKRLGGSSAKSGGSSSSSKSSGDSSSSSSSRSVSGSYSGSSSSSSNKASDKSPGNSSSGSSGSKTSSSIKSKTETKKISYMQDYYKTQTSKSNYNTYKQTLNDEQKKAYGESSNRSYNYGNKMNFEEAMNTRTQRVNYYNASKPSRVNINIGMFSGPFSYGSVFVGPWDLWFLTRASDLFWYHHWAELYLYREYFDAVQFAQREALIRQMEAQGIARDASYVDPDFDYDLQFSPEYVQNHVGSMYYTNKYSKPVKNPFKVLLTIIVLIILLAILIKVVSKPCKVRKYNSSGGIY